MIKSEEKKKNLGILLSKDNSTAIIQAIQMLRDEEPFEGAIGLLASCYDRHSGESVNKEIEMFMNDLKDKSLRSEVINEIKKDHKPGTITMLVASCWQSGLDYSAFVMDFAEAFIRSEYATSLECYTVLDESIASLTLNEKAKLTGYLREKTNSIKGDKKALASDLISGIENRDQSSDEK
ncbi:MAG TPA: hypothetical protein VHO46_05530 [Bacteroidales bacterium]|nr:hypothetical protein [Bacteroidales bacterium]